MSGRLGLSRWVRDLLVVALGFTAAACSDPAAPVPDSAARWSGPPARVVTCPDPLPTGWTSCNTLFQAEWQQVDAAINYLISLGGACGNAGLDLEFDLSNGNIFKIGTTDPDILGISTVGNHGELGITAAGLGELTSTLAHEEMHHRAMTPHDDVYAFGNSCA